MNDLNSHDITIRVAVDPDPGNVAGPYVATFDSAAGMGATPSAAVESLLAYLPDTLFIPASDSGRTSPL